MNTAAQSITDVLQTPPNQTSATDFIQYAQDRVNQQAFVVGSDEKMTRIKEVIDQIKDTMVPVFLTGESGTGKEVIARAIHASSNRAQEAFIAVNCAAIPASLLESELFGHEKGAFTGAHQRHIGKFELASNGTLLLDEVTEMEPALQAKLLRVLQEKEIERIGGTGAIPVKTRIIATTNRDIQAAVSSGAFRQDLYFRLHVIQLEVPALRERPNDIELFARTFLKQFSAQYGKEVPELSHCALKKLMNYRWPGNIRELQNVMQRAVLLTSGMVITGKDLPFEDDSLAQGTDWVGHLPIGRPLRDLETQFILQTLKSHQGNRTHAAKTLGISLRTLRNKINEFTAEGIEVMAPLTGRAL